MYGPGVKWTFYRRKVDGLKNYCSWTMNHVRNEPKVDGPQGLKVNGEKRLKVDGLKGLIEKLYWSQL